MLQTSGHEAIAYDSQHQGRAWPLPSTASILEQQLGMH